MKRLRVAIVGCGRLGHACIAAIRDANDLELAGLVRHESTILPTSVAHVPVAGHIRDLEHVEVALLCVPAEQTSGTAQALLQGRLPIVECARLGDQVLAAHYETIGTAAHRHRVPAIVGAGWDPGALPLLQRLFEVLIPHGQTSLTRHPGLSLHHSPAIEDLAGVQEALIGEFRDADDKPRRYVYIRLAPDADAHAVTRAIRSDPLFADEATEIFALSDLTSLEAPSGLVVERRGTGAPAGEHPALSLDARFDVWGFAARVMVDAARTVLQLGPGAHRYALRLTGMPSLRSP